jgi:hypothetical protein
LRNTSLCFILLTGCGGSAGLELAASDALHAVARQMEVTVQEYHQEVGRQDEARESAVIAAFITRVSQHRDDDAAMQAHAAEFEAALRKVRADRDVEQRRRAAAIENVGVVREIAGGMQRLALESLTLRDEARRYLTNWIELNRRANASVAATGGTR